MGFRSTFITEDINLPIPDWFREKWDDSVFMGKTFPIASRVERKFYDGFSETELFQDIQKILKDSEIEDVQVVLFHECCGITKVKIAKDSITGAEPIEWKSVDQVEHNYCYGCSDESITPSP